MTTIASRLQVVRQRIHAAATAAGRPPGDIGLIAVSKTFPPQAIFEAIHAGQVAFGENYVQEAIGKIAAVEAMLRAVPASEGNGSASPEICREIHENSPQTADLDEKRISLTERARLRPGVGGDAPAGSQAFEAESCHSSGVASVSGPLLRAPDGRVAMPGADSSPPQGDARHSSAVASPQAGPLLRAPGGHVALTSAASDESCGDVRHSSGVAPPSGPLLRPPDGRVAMQGADSSQPQGDARHSSGVASPQAGPLLLPPEWHFIGPIQSNKTRVIAEHFDWVHSVDRLKIAQRLSDARSARLAPLNICIQVNVSAEASKSGVSPEEALPLALAVAALPRLRLRGLMAIPEPTEDNALQRRRFAALRELCERIAAHGLDLDTLSMGMSDDFEAAIAEGATLVRVGRAIFGERTRSNSA